MKVLLIFSRLPWTLRGLPRFTMHPASHRMPPLIRFIVSSLLAAAALVSGSTLAAAEVLPCTSSRSTPYDLEIRGLLSGDCCEGAVFVTQESLRSLPVMKLALDGEFVPGKQEVTAIFLLDLWRALPVAAEADTVLATCSDGYAAIYRRKQVDLLRPFLVLEINGVGPKDWPPQGLNFNPAPGVISVSETVAPAVAGFLDVNHKRPWAVTTLEFVRFDDQFATLYSGPWGSLSERAQLGREIWLNSCLSCHPGPGASFGGTKAGRPFEVLAAHAAFNADYFRRFVRDPQGENSGAKMEPHPHYTDGQLDALIAFITAEKKPALPPSL